MSLLKFSEVSDEDGPYGPTHLVQADGAGGNLKQQIVDGWCTQSLQRFLMQPEMEAKQVTYGYNTATVSIPETLRDNFDQSSFGRLKFRKNRVHGSDFGDNLVPVSDAFRHIPEEYRSPKPLLGADMHNDPMTEDTMPKALTYALRAADDYTMVRGSRFQQSLMLHGSVLGVDQASNNNRLFSVGIPKSGIQLGDAWGPKKEMLGAGAYEAMYGAGDEGEGCWAATSAELYAQGRTAEAEWFLNKDANSAKTLQFAETPATAPEQASVQAHLNKCWAAAFPTVRDLVTAHGEVAATLRENMKKEAVEEVMGFLAPVHIGEQKLAMPWSEVLSSLPDATPSLPFGDVAVTSTVSLAEADPVEVAWMKPPEGEEGASAETEQQVMYALVCLEYGEIVSSFTARGYYGIKTAAIFETVERVLDQDVQVSTEGKTVPLPSFWESDERLWDEEIITETVKADIQRWIDDQRFTQDQKRHRFVELWGNKLTCITIKTTDKGASRVPASLVSADQPLVAVEVEGEELHYPATAVTAKYSDSVVQLIGQQLVRMKALQSIFRDEKLSESEQRAAITENLGDGVADMVMGKTFWGKYGTSIKVAAGVGALAVGAALAYSYYADATWEEMWQLASNSAESAHAYAMELYRAGKVSTQNLINWVVDSLNQLDWSWLHNIVNAAKDTELYKQGSRLIMLSSQWAVDAKNWAAEITADAWNTLMENPRVAVLVEQAKSLGEQALVSWSTVQASTCLWAQNLTAEAKEWFAAAAKRSTDFAGRLQVMTTMALQSGQGWVLNDLPVLVDTTLKGMQDSKYGAVRWIGQNLKKYGGAMVDALMTWDVNDTIANLKELQGYMLETLGQFSALLGDKEHVQEVIAFSGSVANAVGQAGQYVMDNAPAAYAYVMDSVHGMVDTVRNSYYAAALMQKGKEVGELLRTWIKAAVRFATPRAENMLEEGKAFLSKSIDAMQTFFAMGADTEMGQAVLARAKGGVEWVTSTVRDAADWLEANNLREWAPSMLETVKEETQRKVEMIWHAVEQSPGVVLFKDIVQRLKTMATPWVQLVRSYAMRAYEAMLPAMLYLNETAIKPGMAYLSPYVNAAVERVRDLSGYLARNVTLGNMQKAVNMSTDYIAAKYAATVDFFKTEVLAKLDTPEKRAALASALQQALVKMRDDAVQAAKDAYKSVQDKMGELLETDSAKAAFARLQSIKDKTSEAYISARQALDEYLITSGAAQKWEDLKRQAAEAAKSAKDGLEKLIDRAQVEIEGVKVKVGQGVAAMKAGLVTGYNRLRGFVSSDQDYEMRQHAAAARIFAEQARILSKDNILDDRAGWDRLWKVAEQAAHDYDMDTEWSSEAVEWMQANIVGRSSLASTAEHLQGLITAADHEFFEGVQLRSQLQEAASKMMSSLKKQGAAAIESMKQISLASITSKLKAAGKATKQALKDAAAWAGRMARKGWDWLCETAAYGYEAMHALSLRAGKALERAGARLKALPMEVWDVLNLYLGGSAESAMTSEAAEVLVTPPEELKEAFNGTASAAATTITEGWNLDAVELGAMQQTGISPAEIPLMFQSAWMDAAKEATGNISRSSVMEKTVEKLQMLTTDPDAPDIFNQEMVDKILNYTVDAAASVVTGTSSAFKGVGGTLEKMNAGMWEVLNMESVNLESLKTAGATAAVGLGAAFLAKTLASNIVPPSWIMSVRGTKMVKGASWWDSIPKGNMRLTPAIPNDFNLHDAVQVDPDVAVESVMVQQRQWFAGVRNAWVNFKSYFYWPSTRMEMRQVQAASMGKGVNSSRMASAALENSAKGNPLGSFLDSVQLRSGTRNGYSGKIKKVWESMRSDVDGQSHVLTNRPLTGTSTVLHFDGKAGDEMSFTAHPELVDPSVLLSGRFVPGKPAISEEGVQNTRIKSMKVALPTMELHCDGETVPARTLKPYMDNVVRQGWGKDESLQHVWGDEPTGTVQHAGSVTSAALCVCDAKTNVLRSGILNIGAYAQQVAAAMGFKAGVLTVIRQGGTHVPYVLGASDPGTLATFLSDNPTLGTVPEMVSRIVALAGSGNGLGPDYGCLVLDVPISFHSPVYTHWTGTYYLIMSQKPYLSSGNQEKVSSKN